MYITLPYFLQNHTLILVTASTHTTRAKHFTMSKRHSYIFLTMMFTSFITAMATLVSFAQAGSVGVDLFHDGNCQDQFKAITVYGETCYTGSSVGWSSMRVNKYDTLGGELTAYTKNNCGNPLAGSHGYTVSLGACLKDFGFVANAVGLQD